jgi:DNA polymerase V
VAPTKTLAKIASHFAKKHKGYNGVCMMETDAKRLKALALTPIDDVWGIGRRLAPKMLARGIKTALDFVQRPREWVGETFNINLVRTWEELQGRACLEEEREERRKSICTSRSFAEMIEDERELQLRISDFAAMCARKLRQEGSAAYDVTAFLYTNRFREDLQQYFPSATIRLEVAANSAQEIIGAALRGFRTVYRPGYQYKKAGVIVSGIVSDEEIQGSLFDFDDKLRQKQDKLSEVMDAVNAETAGNSLIRLAVQRPGHYADGIRSEFRSNLYSTSLDEIIKVR